ncbi:MAG: tetratricopeptide repeat protein [Bacteroidales bacterium]
MKTNIANIVEVSLIGILSLICISCSSQENKLQQRQKEIQSYADKINSNPTMLNKAVSDTLIALYGSYIKDYPKDTMSEFYLFQMHNIYAAMQNCDSALYCLDKIIKDYPTGKKVGAAYFFKGVVLNDVCLNKQGSILAFEEYIKRYPNNPHVATARRMIQLDTMQDPLEIINKENSLRDK